MTKIIGLTGGIGSGKTTVAQLFSAAGIPVYYADVEAKKISESAGVQAQILQMFGKSITTDNQVDKQKLAQLVFADSAKLNQLNALIHPLVKNHFAAWVQAHADCAYMVKEAAILFETGSAADCDYVVSVVAPQEDRIARVLQRDQVTRAQVLARMQHQWSDDKRIALSDFVIQNQDQNSLAEQVNQLLKSLPK